jgi:hypothetical protein
MIYVIFNMTRLPHFQKRGRDSKRDEGILRYTSNPHHVRSCWTPRQIFVGALSAHMTCLGRTVCGRLLCMNVR